MKCALAGLGSVGSVLADTLVRTSIPITHLIDNDLIEPKNKTKSIYTSKNVGKTKTSVLKEHLNSINPEVSIKTFDSFLEDLSQDNFFQIFSEVDVFLEMADSRKGTIAVVESLKLFYQQQGYAPILVKMICLDNMSAGMTMIWYPDLNIPCPLCLFTRTSYVNTSDERAEKNNEDYSLERYAGNAVRGVMPDLYYGIALTSSLVQSINDLLEKGRSLRKSVYDFFSSNNIVIWSPFRDPYLEWQKGVNVMGSFSPLKLNLNSCVYCE